MAEDKLSSKPVERSLTTDIAIVATPVAILAQPIVGAWANQQFSQGEKPSAEPAPRPENQPKED